jgi:hypothetical protein
MLLLWMQAITKLPAQRETVVMCSTEKVMIFYRKREKRQFQHIQRSSQNLFFGEHSARNMLHYLHVCVTENVPKILKQ